jgi:hypothetical protein
MILEKQKLLNYHFYFLTTHNPSINKKYIVLYKLCSDLIAISTN